MDIFGIIHSDDGPVFHQRNNHKDAMQLDDLKLFADVARLGSYARAAEANGVSRSTLSRIIQRLEAEAGVPLLHRTTRRVGLTSAGATLLDRVRPALDDLHRAIDDLRDSRGAPAGLLRVTASADVGATILAPVIAALVTRYPQLRVETILTLRPVDLVAERVDVALRLYTGQPTDGGLTGRRLMDMAFGWYAAPAYLERRGVPQDEPDLAAHELIAPSRTHSKARVQIDDPFFALALARAGAGLGLLPQDLCGEDVERGALIRVLPEVSLFTGQLWLVYPTGGGSPAVAAFRDAVLDHLTATG